MTKRPLILFLLACFTMNCAWCGEVLNPSVDDPLGRIDSLTVGADSVAGRLSDIAIRLDGIASSLDHVKSHLDSLAVVRNRVDDSFYWESVIFRHGWSINDTSIHYPPVLNFGFKAYHWQGEVYGGCDSLHQVGYRKYRVPEDSFLDHAKFLKGPRYSILYQFDVTDYRSWAQGLRDCGYAEDVNYPDKLIRIIEQYELYAINGGKRMDGSMPVQASIDNDDTAPSKDRWHHRKRRNQASEPVAQQQTSSQEEPQQTYTPLRQGMVPASSDND